MTVSSEDRIREQARREALEEAAELVDLELRRALEVHCRIIPGDWN